jgi:hypothetical protein
MTNGVNGPRRVSFSLAEVLLFLILLVLIFTWQGWWTDI